MKLYSLLAWCGLLVAGPSGAAPVTVDGGQIDGVSSGGVVAYRGIPYAAAPVGALRWRAPQPVVLWQGVRRTESYGHDCAQLPFPQDSAPLRTTPAEDCLYLNVWHPATAGERRPVMVWIHGGGFVTGGSSPAAYDGATLASQGVVLVSLNYRLGRLGFFAHPALSAESVGQPVANYALLDQMAALAWVRRNIAAFGGDPDRVTIFGESAGGSSVAFLLASPMARGLFHQAIIESGALRYALAPFSTAPGGALKTGLDFAASAGIAGADAAALSALRSLPASSVTAGVGFFSRDANFSGPTLDGRIIAEAPLSAFAAGRQARVPLIVGSNSFEWGFMTLPGFPAEAKPDAQLLAEFGALAGPAARAYAAEIAQGGLQLQARLFSDRTFVEPTRALARSHAAALAPTYRYRFSYVGTAARGPGAVQGAVHASEIPYVFGNLQARAGERVSPADARVSAALRARWIAFARTGAPQVGGLAEWQRSVGSDDLLLEVDAQPRMRPDEERPRLDLLEAAAATPEK
jgi:para-nitrobenzyl esterase